MELAPSTNKWFMAKRQSRTNTASSVLSLRRIAMNRATKILTVCCIGMFLLCSGRAPAMASGGSADYRQTKADDPSKFLKFLNDGDFVREFKTGFEKSAGYALNDAQMNYVWSVIV